MNAKDAADDNGDVNSGRTVGMENNDASGIHPTVTTAATDIESEVSSVTDLEIQDIEGVGPTTEKKLKQAGIVSPMDLAVATADDGYSYQYFEGKCCCIYYVSSKTLERL